MDGRCIVLLIRKQAIYERISGRLSCCAPYFPDTVSFQNWIMQGGKPAAILLDEQWPQSQEIVDLASRMEVSVEWFYGFFDQADAWLQQQVQALAVANLEGAMNPRDVDPAKTQPTTSMLVHDNPLLKRKRKQVSLGSSNPPITDAHSPASSLSEPTIIERIVEVPVEKEIRITESIQTTLRPELWVVLSLWPRAGVTTVAMILAGLWAKHLPVGSVTLVEHPELRARFWDYFQIKEPYTPWWIDGKGTRWTTDQVSVVPAPLQPHNLSSDQLLSFLYKQLKQPITILDMGQLQDDLVLNLADRIFLVMDADITLFAHEDIAKEYRRLYERYQPHVMINKWFPFCKFKDDEDQPLFPDAYRIPYLPPESVQGALWNGTLPTEQPEILEGLRQLAHKLHLTIENSSKRTMIQRIKRRIMG